MVPSGIRGRGMRSLVEEMERMMSGSPWWPLRASGLVGAVRSASDWMPDVDVFEKDNKVVVRADLPGMRKEDIGVSVQNDTLILRGHREEEKKVKGDEYYRSERASGDFYRVIALPGGVDPSDIEASYKDGVLEIAVPQREEQEPPSVQIKVQ